jgi:hypothetical protein
MAIVDPSSREDSDKLRRIAYHEAGHTVAAFVFGYSIAGVVIDREPTPGNKADRQARHFVELSHMMPVDEMEKTDAENRAVFAFAGDAAAMHLTGSRPAGELFDHGCDYWVAMSAAWKFFPENRERHAFLEAMEDRAHTFVKEPLRWHQIQTLAAALLERRDMFGHQVVELLKHAVQTFEPAD